MSPTTHERPPAAHGAGRAGGHPGHAPRNGHGGAGHGDHAAAFRDRFWLSLVLAVPVIVYSEMIQDWFGYSAPGFPGSDLIAPLLGTVVFAYGGWPFLTGAVGELRARRPGMMTLVGMAISVAFAASLASTAGLVDIEFWWELAALIVIMLLGHWLEMRAVGQARGALEALAELLPDEAERIEGDDVVAVPLDALRVGDLVLVRPGGRIPADGVVRRGAAAVDESMITGESRPVPREEGDRVVAGAVSTDSALRVEVTAVGEETALAGIRRLVEEAEASRSRAQLLADRAAAFLFYVAVGAAVVTAAVWLALGEPESALERTVTVLVIACPHALGLAIPLVIAISTRMSAASGVLVTDRLALERMRLVDTVVFDKTGTLTEGRHRVTGAAAVDGDTTALLGLAAAVEGESEHPMARAIREAAEQAGAALPPVTAVRSRPGRGVLASVAGADVAVGGPSLLRELGIAAPDRDLRGPDDWRSRGASVVHVVRDGRVVGAIAVEDTIRPTSRAALDGLRAARVRTAMITGDARPVAEAVATRLGIDEVLAEVLPEDKESSVASLQAQGRTVAMVGDGVNDAPALARADVGIAIGAGTDVAVGSAGIVLASDDPRAVLSVRRLSAAGYRKMLQNLIWAAGYNVAAIPLAAGVLAFAGITLSPAVGAVLMSVSTVVVALNAQLLRRVDLRPSA